MTDSWLDAQQAMNEAWYNFFFGASRNGHSPYAPYNPVLSMMETYTSNFMEQWQKALRQNAELFSPASAGAAKLALQQFAASQEHMMQIMRTVTDFWQSMAMNNTSPEEWQQNFQRVAEQWREQLAQPLDLFKSTENVAELWNLYLQETQKFSQPWFKFWSQANGAGSGTPELVELGNLYWDAWEQTWGRLLGAPNMGLTREFTEKLDRAFMIWVNNQRVSQEYLSLVGNTWIKAIEALMQKLVEMSTAGQTLENQKAFVDLWVEVADAQFIELFHSDAYAAVQGQLVNSSMEMRRQQRELMEVWLRANDLPTRSDVDEAHHQLYTLRKELKGMKTLRSQIDELQALRAEIDALKQELKKVQTSVESSAGQAAPKKSTKRRSTSTRSKKSTKTADTATKPKSQTTGKTSAPSTDAVNE